MTRDEETHDHSLAEKINRIADFGIEAASQELAGRLTYWWGEATIDSKGRLHNRGEKGSSYDSTLPALKAITLTLSPLMIRSAGRIIYRSVSSNTGYPAAIFVNS